jgi:hypothetical protein
MVTAVTEFIRRGLHNDPAMTRRAFGVVLIVALMGWTVNQPLQGEGQHSRAAVVVLAGASPAYQPEPSPTRHSCCPRESHHAAVSAQRIPSCHPHSTSDCCSLSKGSQGRLPPGLVKRFCVAILWPRFPLYPAHRCISAARLRGSRSGLFAISPSCLCRPAPLRSFLPFASYPMLYTRGTCFPFPQKIKTKRIDSGEQNENSNDRSICDSRVGRMASGYGTTGRRTRATQPASAGLTGGFRKTCRSIPLRLLRQNE